MSKSAVEFTPIKKTRRRNTTEESLSGSDCKNYYLSSLQPKDSNKDKSKHKVKSNKRNKSSNESTFNIKAYAGDNDDDDTDEKFSYDTGSAFISSNSSSSSNSSTSSSRSSSHELQQRQQQQLYQINLSPRFFQYLQQNRAALPPLSISTTYDVEQGADFYFEASSSSDVAHNNHSHDEQGDENSTSAFRIRDHTQVETGSTALPPFATETATSAATATVSSTRKRLSNMPLSQGYYAKGAFAATKRAAIKATRINDEPKQRKYGSENNNCNKNGNNNSNNTRHGSYGNTLAAPKSSPLAATKTATASTMTTTSMLPGTNSLLHQQLLGGSAKGNYNNNNGADINSGGGQQSLQLSYYLAEYLARCGRLQEAFDIYAFIAGKQLDGNVPLDRLNVLTTCLVSYVRQLNRKLEENSYDGSSSADATVPPNSSDGHKFVVDPVGSYEVNQQMSWPRTVGGAKIACLSTAPSIADAIDVDAASLELLAAPLRESYANHSDGSSDLSNTVGLATTATAEIYDALLCPLCNDILRCPVTTNCGHTFCRQCCEVITMCNICHTKFPRIAFDDFTTAATKPSSSSSSMLGTAATLLSTTIVPTQTSLGPSFAMLYNGGGGGGGGGSGGNNQASPLILDNFHASRLVHSTTPPYHIGTTAMSRVHANVGGGSVLLQIGAATGDSSLPTSAPRTVTTSTVSLTTATTTTTMASTPASHMGAIGTVGGAAHSIKFMTDVTVRRLVEKWWGPDLQAQKISETAASYMHLNLLDDALKFCNASLEKSPSNFKCLLLRAEVLRKLNHFQSSLADVDNALRNRYTSAKAHYLRAMVLGELGRIDEALFDNCLAISLDKVTNLSSSEIFQHDLAKILQRLLAQAPKSKVVTVASPRHGANAAPYSILAEHRLRRKQIALLSNANGDNLSSLEPEYVVACPDMDELGKQCIVADADIIANEDEFLVGNEFAENRTTTAYADCDYELMALRRPTLRKHFRRKWATKETELIPTTMALDDARCSALFRSVLERIQQELQRLKKLKSSGESHHKQLLQVPQNLIDASDFDCVLCCRTFWKPVVTPCGHTYCWVCLDRCMDYTSSCPLCMSPLVEPNVNMYQGSSSPVPFVLAKRPVTKFLEAAMKRFIPESYERRFRQEMDMEPSVPMFICTTAFPYVPCPLFVYEPRYRLMVRRAVESGEKQFGIVQPHSGKSRYFDVGTILDIRDCVLLGDGCSILSTIGCKRFKILARNEKDGYETAKVEYIYDETIADENVKFVTNMHAAVLTKAIEWFESLSVDLKQEILQSFGEMPPVEDNWESIADGPAWAWWIIALLPLSQQLKVDILATTSLEKRLRAIEKTLDYMSGTIQRSQQNCGVVVVQQQQHQQQQHDQEQQQCENNNLTGAQTAQDECCQRTTSATHSHHHHHHHHHEHHHHHHGNAAVLPTSAATPTTDEQHSQLLL